MFSGARTSGVLRHVGGGGGGGLFSRTAEWIRHFGLDIIADKGLVGRKEGRKEGRASPEHEAGIRNHVYYRKNWELTSFPSDQIHVNSPPLYGYTMIINILIHIDIKEPLKKN